MTTENYRTAHDARRLADAEALAAKHRERCTVASSHVAKAEQACAESPSARSFALAKEAKDILTDCERDLTLAKGHVSKVAAEVAANENDAMRRDLRRRERELHEVADSETKELAVELAILGVRLRQQIADRAPQRRDQLLAINALRARLGEPEMAVPSEAALTEQAVVTLATLGLTVQAALGAPERDVGWTILPLWRPSGSAREYVTGREGLIVHRTMPDGSQETSGQDCAHIVAEARALLARVQQRCSTPTTKCGSTFVQAATMVGIAAMAACFCAGG